MTVPGAPGPVDQTARERWDARYADGSYTPRDEPSDLLLRWLDRLPRGRALDVATGTGRHALALAEAGFDVTAVDVSPVAVEQARATAAARGLDVEWVVADLGAFDLPAEQYDVVTVFRFRDPALWARLRDALRPDGWILVEHHLRTPLDVGGPTDEAFRIAPGELLEAFAGFRVVFHEEAVEDADHPRATGQRFANTRFVACKGDPGW